MIDVELARDLPSGEAFRRAGERGLIVSSHSITKVGRAEWNRLVHEVAREETIRKVVVPATMGQALSEFIPSLPPPGESPLVALTTGPSGPLLRAWSKRLGFPLVYAALPERFDDTSPHPVETSQIPVDRLRPFLEAEGSPPLFAVVGHPVGHSRSPTLHARWMRERGDVGLYLALDYESDPELVDSLPALVDGGFRGLNITHPFKQVAFELADRIGPGAQACGVANVLSLGHDGAEAENTDLVAALRRLDELRESAHWDGTSLGVIGAGGAARASLAAARSQGVESYVWARRPEDSKGLAREFGAHAVDDAKSAHPTLVVHATPVGRSAERSGSMPAPGWLRSGVYVLDWVYTPEEPIVRLAAERVGATYEDGSRLLVYQAAASYGIWWDEEPSAEQVSRALEEVV